MEFWNGKTSCSFVPENFRYIAGVNPGRPTPFATSYMVGREDKRANNRTMLPTLKNNAATGYQGPVKIELLKNAVLLAYPILPFAFQTIAFEPGILLFFWKASQHNDWDCKCKLSFIEQRQKNVLKYCTKQT